MHKRDAILVLKLSVYEQLEYIYSLKSCLQFINISNLPKLHKLKFPSA